MENKMFELQKLLKEKAVEITSTRQEHKKLQRENKNALDWELSKLRKFYRHHHIAYSELRGRTREQIEKPAEDNLPDEVWILEIKEEYGQQ